MNLKSSLWVLGVCFAVPASAAAQTVPVYYSVGKEIRTLNALAAPGGPTTLVHTSTMLVGDLALCAGNAGGPASDTGQYLYFVERNAAGDRISRLDIKTAVPRRATANPSAVLVFPVPVDKGRVGELRLTAECDVMFATSQGVFQVNGTSPLSGTATPLPNAIDPIETDAGSGLAVAFDGSLRYSDGSALQSLSGFSATVPASPIVGLGVANAGHASLTAARLPSPYEEHPLPVGPVCASAANTITCFRKTGGNTGSAPFATFDAVNKAQFFEFLTDDRAIAATSVNADAGLGGSAKFNGILWRVDAGVVTELTRGPKVNGEFVPIVGVAVGPSTAEATTASATQHKVNFGPVAFDAVTQAACSLNVKLRQLTWPEADAKIGQLSSPKYSRDPGSGSESWIDNVEVTVASGNCGFTLGPALVGIAQYIDNAPSRAVVHCHADQCTLATHGNYPYSTPDDERDSALPDNFSDFLTAKITSDAGALQFSSPLNSAAIVSGPIDTEIAAASTHNASGGLSIRFRICEETCATFAPAEQPNPPFSGAGLSVTRLTNSGVAMADCIVIDQGSSTPDLPVFRTSDSSGVTHNFNLNTPIDGPPACQLADVAKGDSGLFVATVFSHGGTFTKTSILFKLIK